MDENKTLRPHEGIIRVGEFFSDASGAIGIRGRIFVKCRFGENVLSVTEGSQLSMVPVLVSPVVAVAVAVAV